MMGIESNISQNENAPEAADTDFGPDSWEKQIDEEPAEPSDTQEQPAQYSLRGAKEYLQAFEKDELPFISGKVPLTPELLKALGVVEGEAPDIFKRWEAILGARGQLAALRKALKREPAGGDQTTQLVRLCDGIELLRDTGCDRDYFATVKVAGVKVANHDRDYFATVKVADHRETYRLDSPDMQRWLRNHYFEKTGQAPSIHRVIDAIGVLQGGRAQSQAREVPIYLRCGRDDVIGDVYIDLGRRDWKICENQSRWQRL